MNKLPKNTFGLNISDSVLTAVELAYNRNTLKVVNFSRVELEPGIVEDNCIIVDPEAFKAALNRLIKEGSAGPIISKNVIISVPEEKTFTHRLLIPHESEHDREFIMRSAKDFIPIELTETVMDYNMLNTCSSNKEVKFNFVAIQKSIVESLINILAETGLKVVYVDVDKNSLIRACENRFQTAAGDFIIVNINDEASTFSVNSRTGISYTQESEIAGNEFLKKIRENSASDAKAILNELAKDPNAPEKELYKAVQAILKESYDALINKISETAGIAQSQDSLRINTIYLVGSHSRMPGLYDAFKNAFPDIKIIPAFQYIHLDENTELYYVKALGLALKAVLQEEDPDEINLLPQHKKEELFHMELTPVVMRSFLAVCFCLAGAILFSGFSTAKAYLGLKVSEKEAEILVEKSQNPYLRRVAQDTQQKTQLESQISTILKDAIPLGDIMRKMDEYNSVGIDVINASYKLENNGTNDMRIRAKTESREDTEKFIKDLEGDSYFSKVISPLSNLTGKGERFININLVVDTTAILSGEDTAKTPEKSREAPADKTPKKPAPKIRTSASSADAAADKPGDGADDGLPEENGTKSDAPAEEPSADTGDGGVSETTENL